MLKQKALATIAGAFFVCANFALRAQSVTNVNGVRTVVYGANAKPKGKWAINPTPLVRITSDNGVDLLDIGAVARFADGSLMAMSRQSTQLRFFAPNGKHLRDVGRKGRGPGEFDSGYSFVLFRIGDTIIVSDGTATAQVFAPDGKYLRTEARPKGGPQGQQTMRIGYFADGRLVLQTYPGRDTLPPARKMLYSALLAERNGVRTEIGQFAFQLRLSIAKGPGYAEAFGGYGSAVLLRSAFCTAFPDVFAIDCFSADGKRLSHMERRDVLGRPITDADKQEYFASIANMNSGPQQATVVAQYKAVTTFAKSRPLFGRLLRSLNDEIWVEPSLPASSGNFSDPVPDIATVWSVFAPNGDWLSDVTLPKRFRLMEVGANYVAGVIRDSDDIEEVVVYSLLKR